MLDETARLLELRAEMIWKADAYSMHWRCCFTRRTGAHCLRCDQLEIEALTAGDVYLAAGGQING